MCTLDCRITCACDGCMLLFFCQRQGSLLSVEKKQGFTNKKNKSTSERQENHECKAKLASEHVKLAGNVAPRGTMANMEQGVAFPGRIYCKNFPVQWEWTDVQEFVQGLSIPTPLWIHMHRKGLDMRSCYLHYKATKGQLDTYCEHLNKGHFLTHKQLQAEVSVDDAPEETVQKRQRRLDAAGLKSWSTGGAVEERGNFVTTMVF